MENRNNNRTGVVVLRGREARKALLDEIDREQRRARSHFKVATKENRTRNGVTYASAHEMMTHANLEALERVGQISNLRRNVRFELWLEGELLCRYYADHVYYDNVLKREIVADSKGKRTPLFILKKKLMRILLGIEVVEL